MQHFQKKVAKNVVIYLTARIQVAEGTLYEALFKAQVLGNDGPEITIFSIIFILMFRLY